VKATGFFLCVFAFAAGSQCLEDTHKTW